LFVSCVVRVLPRATMPDAYPSCHYTWCTADPAGERRRTAPSRSRRSALIAVATLTSGLTGTPAGETLAPPVPLEAIATASVEATPPKGSSRLDLFSAPLAALASILEEERRLAAARPVLLVPPVSWEP
jgi:hypothetical protein